MEYKENVLLEFKNWYQHHCHALLNIKLAFSTVLFLFSIKYSELIRLINTLIYI